MMKLLKTIRLREHALQVLLWRLNEINVVMHVLTTEEQPQLVDAVSMQHATNRIARAECTSWVHQRYPLRG